MNLKQLPCQILWKFIWVGQIEFGIVWNTWFTNWIVRKNQFEIWNFLKTVVPFFVMWMHVLDFYFRWVLFYLIVHIGRFICTYYEKYYLKWWNNSRGIKYLFNEMTLLFRTRTMRWYKQTSPLIHEFSASWQFFKTNVI